MAWSATTIPASTCVVRSASAASDTDSILVRAGYQTPTKTRILAGFPTGIKQQIVRFDREEDRRLSAAELARIESGLRAKREARVAILSDYGYGTVAPELVAAVRSAHRRPRARSSSTAASGSPTFAGVDGATPNEEEAESLLGRPLDDDRGRRRARRPPSSAGASARASFSSRAAVAACLVHDEHGAAQRPGARHRPGG